MTTRADLHCAEAVELVTDYLEDALPLALAREVARHLDACEDCEIYLDQIRNTVDLLQTLVTDPLPPYVRERLLAAFREAAQR